MVLSYPKYTVQDTTRNADILRGAVYHAEVTSETVADDGYLSMHIQPNSVARVGGLRLRIIATTNGLSQMFVAENASLELAGTGESLRNLNRITGDTATSTITVGGSYSGADFDIFEQMWGSTGPFAAGGDESFFFVLDPGKDYNINLFNRSGGAQAMALEAILTETPE